MDERIIQQIDVKSQKVAALTKTFMTELEKHFNIEAKKYSKNAFLVSKNELNNNIYFIKKGCVRSFIHDEDFNEITIWFSFEGQVIFSSTSYILELPSTVMIQALENTEVIVLTKQELNALYERAPKFSELGRMIMEMFLVLLSMRAISLQTMLAEVRYKRLIEHSPNILKRVPLRHIASYIGVKMETLSRIRANYRSSNQ